jgi:CrcB protein
MPVDATNDPSGQPAQAVTADDGVAVTVQPATTPWDVVLAVGVGGVAGAEARYLLSEAVPHSAGQFPWSTLIINVSGSLLLGVLMVLVLELTSAHRLLRPLLGAGVLGGYTTFSTFAVDVDRLISAHRPMTAAQYVLVTVFGCAVAVWAATVVTQRSTEAVIAARVRRRLQRSER